MIHRGRRRPAWSGFPARPWGRSESLRSRHGRVGAILGGLESSWRREPSCRFPPMRPRRSRSRFLPLPAVRRRRPRPSNRRLISTAWNSGGDASWSWSRSFRSLPRRRSRAVRMPRSWLPPWSSDSSGVESSSWAARQPLRRTPGPRRPAENLRLRSSGPRSSWWSFESSSWWNRTWLSSSSSPAPFGPSSSWSPSWWSSSPRRARRNSVWRCSANPGIRRRRPGRQTWSWSSP